MPHADGIQDEVRHILPGEATGEDEGAVRDRRESAERYFSVRWMLERERAREESDDCSSAFAIIPVGKSRTFSVRHPCGLHCNALGRLWGGSKFSVKSSLVCAV